MKDILYRLTRIFLVLVFVFCLSLVRENVQANYNDASKIISNTPKFVVNNIDNSIEKNGLGEKYKVEIKNISNSDKNISFVINGNSKFAYNYMNYKIVKDDVLVSEGTIEKSGTIYSDSLKKNENSIYEIEFWINGPDIGNLKNLNTKAKLSFV